MREVLVRGSKYLAWAAAEALTIGWFALAVIRGAAPGALLFGLGIVLLAVVPFAGVSKARLLAATRNHQGVELNRSEG